MMSLKKEIIERALSGEQSQHMGWATRPAATSEATLPTTATAVRPRRSRPKMAHCTSKCRAPDGSFEPLLRGGSTKLNTAGGGKAAPMGEDRAEPVRNFVCEA